MLGKIGIDRNAVLRPAKMHPVRLRHDLALPLLQKYDVACDIGSRTVLKGCIGEADCAEQLRPFRKVLPYGRIRLVKRPLACNKCHNAARSDLIQRFRKKIIMDTEVVLCVLCVIELVIAKRHVAHRNIEKVVGVLRFLKSPYLYLCFGIEQLCDPPTDVVLFHAVKPAVLHGFR